MPENQKGAVETAGSLDREAGTGAPVGGIVVSSAAKSEAKDEKEYKDVGREGPLG